MSQQSILQTNITPFPLHHQTLYCDYAGHGAVGMAWLEAIVKDHLQLSDALKSTINAFVKKCTSPTMSGQVMRVARRFALVATAGELASHYGLTGWSSGEA